jgi:hypothetical protein
MPDDLHLPLPRRQPEDMSLGRIQSDLEFLIEQVSWLPNPEGTEPALRPLLIIAGAQGLLSPASSFERPGAEPWAIIVAGLTIGYCGRQV